MTWWFCSKRCQFSLTFNLYQWLLGNINWGITVILIINYCFNFSPHSYLPQATSWFVLKTPCLVQSHLLSLLFRAEDLWDPKIRVSENKERQVGAGRCLYLLKMKGKSQIFLPFIHTVFYLPPHQYSTLTPSLFYSVGRDFSLGSWWRVSGEDVSYFPFVTKNKRFPDHIYFYKIQFFLSQ